MSGGGIRGVTRVDADDVDAITAILADAYHRHAILNTLTPPDPRQVTRFSRRFQNGRFMEILDSVCDGSAPTISTRH